MTLHPMDRDKELLARFARGEDSAFDVLFDRHARRVFDYLTRVMGDAEVAAAEQVGMCTMEQSLARLVRQGLVDAEEARRVAPDPPKLERYLTR